MKPCFRIFWFLPKMGKFCVSGFKTGTFWVKNWLFVLSGSNKKEMSFRNLQRQCIKCSSGDVQYLALYLERFSHYLKKCHSCTLTPRFPGKSHFPGSHISQEVTFPGKSYFPGSHLSHKVTIPGKLHFPGSHISWEVTFPGKSQFPGNHISQEVTFSGK